MRDEFQSEKGYALIIVMWGLVIITIIFVNLLDEVQLSSLLLRHNLDEKKVYQIAISEITRGINLLRKDKTAYDSKKDQWYSPLAGQMDNLRYELEIVDIGSRVNINYTDNSILAEFSWFNKDLKKRIEEDELIYQSFLLKDILKEEYSKASQEFTTYGRFSINTDRLGGLRKLMVLAGVGESQINLIIGGLKDLREDGQIINSLEEMPLYLQGMDLISFDNLKPYLTTDGRYNVNLVPEETLTAVFEGLKIKKDYLQGILTYRQQKEIKELRELDFMPEGELKRLEPYLKTSSNYFLIKAGVFTLSGDKADEIKTVVRRARGDNGQWQIEILKWSEGE